MYVAPYMDRLGIFIPQTRVTDRSRVTELLLFDRTPPCRGAAAPRATRHVPRGVTTSKNLQVGANCP